MIKRKEEEKIKRQAVEKTERIIEEAKIQEKIAELKIEYPEINLDKMKEKRLPSIFVKNNDSLAKISTSEFLKDGLNP